MSDFESIKKLAGEYANLPDTEDDLRRELADAKRILLEAVRQFGAATLEIERLQTWKERRMALDLAISKEFGALYAIIDWQDGLIQQLRARMARERP